jgi:squalene monooxygenase
MSSSIAPSPSLLAYHFFVVAFYSIWVLFTHPRPVPAAKGDKPKLEVARIREYPRLAVKAIRTVGASVSAIGFWGLTYCCGQFWTACVVFGPLLWSEIRWWAPHNHAARSRVVVSTLLLLFFGALVGWRWIS